MTDPATTGDEGLTDVGATLYSTIPKKFLFNPRNENEKVVLDCMGAMKASRIPKAEAISFMANSLDPHVLLHPNVIGNSRLFHALHDFLLSYATGANALEFPTTDISSLSTSRRKVIHTLYADWGEILRQASNIMDEVESIDFSQHVAGSTGSAGSGSNQDALAKEKVARQKRAIGVSARFSSLEMKYSGLTDSDI